MVENTEFTDEWNKLQKAFWEDMGARFAHLSQSNSDVEDGIQHSQPSLLFSEWINDVDKCWQDHAQVTSGDIDSLYSRVSTSSRFFFHFAESMVSNQQSETADVLITKYLKPYTDTFAKSVTSSSRHSASGKIDGNNNHVGHLGHQSAAEKKEHNPDTTHAFYQPLLNWQQQVALFSLHIQSLNTLSEFLGNAVDDVEFSTALEAYLLALQAYQQLLFTLFFRVLKHVVKVLQDKDAQSVSARQMLIQWLELLEAHYLELITSESYSRAYANVVNSLMRMIDKSNKSYTDFMSSDMSSQVNSYANFHDKAHG